MLILFAFTLAVVLFLLLTLIAAGCISHSSVRVTVNTVWSDLCEDTVTPCCVSVVLPLSRSTDDGAVRPETLKSLLLNCPVALVPPAALTLKSAARGKNHNLHV